VTVLCTTIHREKICTISVQDLRVISVVRNLQKSADHIRMHTMAAHCASKAIPLKTEKENGGIGGMSRKKYVAKINFATNLFITIITTMTIKKVLLIIFSIETCKILTRISLQNLAKDTRKIRIVHYLLTEFVKNLAADLFVAN